MKGFLFFLAMIASLSLLSIESLNSSSLGQQPDINLCDFDRIKKFDTNGKVIGSWGI